MRTSILDWRHYPAIARIANMAACDVGRGSETLMTYSRGDLFHAARHLVSGRTGRSGRNGLPARELVVTGFFIPKADQPAAETDGPLGALEVCMALRAIGGDAWLVSDECCEPVIRPAALGFLPEDHVLIAPDVSDSPESDNWSMNSAPRLSDSGESDKRAHGGTPFDAWLNRVIDLVRAEGISTLIYIERVGPARDGNPHNMRGIDITEWTAPLSQLTLMGLHTIGVGDGGNEIGHRGRGGPRYGYRVHGVDGPACGGGHVELGRSCVGVRHARVRPHGGGSVYGGRVAARGVGCDCCAWWA